MQLYKEGKHYHCICDECEAKFTRLAKHWKRPNFAKRCDECNKKHLSISSVNFYASEEGKKFAINRGKVRSIQLSTVEGLAKFLLNRPRGTDHHMYRDDLPDFKIYRSLVDKYSRKFLTEIRKLENYGLRGRCGVEGAYQIDHKVSVRYGFDHKISPEIIGHISNLEMIPWKENLAKKKSCSMDINTLINCIKEYQTTHEF